MFSVPAEARWLRAIHVHKIADPSKRWPKPLSCLNLYRSLHYKVNSKYNETSAMISWMFTRIEMSMLIWMDVFQQNRIRVEDILHPNGSDCRSGLLRYLQMWWWTDQDEGSMFNGAVVVCFEVLWCNGLENKYEKCRPYLPLFGIPISNCNVWSFSCNDFAYVYGTFGRWKWWMLLFYSFNDGESAF